MYISLPSYTKKKLARIPYHPFVKLLSQTTGILRVNFLGSDNLLLRYQ